MPGQLHRGRADRPRGSIDQQPLALPNLQPTHEERGDETAVGQGGGFLVREVGRSKCERRTRRPAHLLGVCTGAETVHSENLVTWLEGGYLAADRLDLAGRDHADNPLPRRPDAERRSHEEPVDAAQLEASHDAVAGCDRGRDKPDAHFLVPGTRVGHSPDLEHLGRPVGRANGGSHSLSSARSLMAVMNLVTSTVLPKARPRVPLSPQLTPFFTSAPTPSPSAAGHLVTANPF